ncbi:MAG: hypothetical protein L3J23_01265 [Flavobacteriaceae bacterium]|nr:hypothetical protein [Flavobacteriaceae bacterium]
MKKKLIYILIGFLLILSIAYLTRYKLGDNFENKIPKDTTAVLKINLRQLEHHFLIDFLSNPLSYLKTAKTKKKDTKETPSFLKGIEVPKNILFYSKDTNKWVSTKIKIKDAKIVGEFLISKGFKFLQLKEVYSYSKKLITAIIKEGYLIITYNGNKNVNSYFNQNSFLDHTSLLLQKLTKSDCDVYYVSTMNEELKGNFNNGNIQLNGNANFNFLENKTHYISNSSIGSIVVTLNKEHNFSKKLIATIHKQKFKNFTKLVFDSVYNKWNGSINFNLKSFKTRIDTIKTYEYDADFHKIEKIAIQKTTNPDFVLSIGNSSNLYYYLENANTLKITANKSIFIPLPIITTFVKTTTNATAFYTSEPIGKLNKEINNKLTINFDFDTYRKNTLNTPFYHFETINSIQKCTILISKDNELSLKIDMKNKIKNALIQFIK